MLQFLGHVARWIVRRLIRIYYPTLEVSGRENIPRSGAVLLVANHANSLLDPVMVGIAANRPVRFFAKAPLFDTPALGSLMRAFGMLPAFRSQDDKAREQVRRNLESLQVGAEALARGDAVGIFPEGKSHDSLQLEQIRSGAARMAIQAVLAGARDLKIVPVGINYQRKQLFRSAVWLRVGEPVDVAALVQEHGGDERKAMRALTEAIEAHLKAVTLHLADAMLEPFLDELELLLPPRRLRGHVSISALRQRKRIADAMNHFLVHDRERAEEMAGAIREYRSRLRDAGLSSHSPVMRLRTWKLLLTIGLEALWLLYWFPAALIGAIFHIVPFSLARVTARKLQDGGTTIALFRLGLGFPIYGLWHVGAWFALRSYFLPWVAWTTVALLPLAGVLALTWAHRARAACRNWLQQTRAMLHPGQLLALRAAQQRLREQLGEFAARYAEVVPFAEAEIRRRSWRDRGRIALRWAVILIVAAGLFVAQNSWFKHRAETGRMSGLNLAGMSATTLQATLTADETALTDILASLTDLERRALVIKTEFDAGKRTWYRQEDNDAVRGLLLAYLNYRAALLRVIWKYQHYDDVRAEADMLRAFLNSYTAATTLYSTSLKFVRLFERAPDAIRKLNEAEPLWEIPPGLYDTLRRNLANPEDLHLLWQARRDYRRWNAAFAQHNLATNAPFDTFHAAIASAERSFTELSVAAIEAGTTSPLIDARDTGKEAIYRAQTFISSWIGDTKVREPRGGKTLIQARQVTTLRRLLKPGDVLLERRNWFLSNAFLPGYWPHTALYVGTVEDMRRLGLDRDPRVEKHWREFLKRDEHGRERVILEAISEGVVFTALEHSVGEADSAAFLRPRLPDDKIKEAIARAFSHAGKPYDFEFDFFSTDKLVCSELVFRAYDGEITFPLVDVMGRKTLPPIELVKQCRRERGTAKAQFDFVAFLDGSEAKGRAEFATEDAFFNSADRPALTWQQK